MRRAISVTLQFLLFLLTFALGSFLLHPFHLETISMRDPTRVHIFVWDGLILMLILYLLVLGLEVALKKIHSAARWSTLAVALATGAGLLMRFGFITTQR